MLFVTGTDLRERLGLPSLDTIQAAADAAAQAAVRELETDIRTPFEAATYSDLFYLDPPDLTMPRLKLKLTAGFVTGTVEIGVGFDATAAQADNSLADYALVDYTAGVVVLTLGQRDRFISVRYSAGFDPQDSDPTLFNVPDPHSWLLEAALLRGISLLADSPDLEAKDSAMVDGLAYRRQYGTLVTPRIRYAPMSRTPLI